MRVIHFLGILGLSLALSACAAWVKTEYDPAANFAQLHSFAWRAPAHGKVDDPILDSELLDRRVREAVTKTLTARGFAPGPPESADFIVTYHTTKSMEVRSSPFATAIGVGRYWNDPFLQPYPFYGSVVVSNDVQSYDQGTLILDLIDAKTDRLIWRGWRTHALQQKFFDATGVQQMVEEILAKFPPGHDTNSR